MKKVLPAILLILAACSLARAQVQPVQATLNSVSTGACTPASCLVYTVPSGVGAVTFSLTGTSGTVTFEAVDINGNYSSVNATQSNSSSPVTSATVSGNSQFQINTAGYYQVRARLTSTGSVAVVINPSTASARSSGSGGGSTTCSTTDAIIYALTSSTYGCDPGITTNTSGQLSATGGFVGAPDGVHPWSLIGGGNTTLPTLSTNKFGLFGPPSATFTSWSLQFGSAIPATGDLFSCVVTSTNCLLSDSGFSASSFVKLTPTTSQIIQPGASSSAIPLVVRQATGSPGTNVIFAGQDQNNINALLVENTAGAFPNVVQAVGTFGFNGVGLGGSSFGSMENWNTAGCETNDGITTVNTGSATTTTGLSCIPASAVIDAVLIITTTTIGTATSFEVGVSGSLARYCAAGTTNVTSGQTTQCLAQINGGTSLNTSGTTPIVVTFNGTPSSGAMRIIVYYHNFTAPTS